MSRDFYFFVKYHLLLLTTHYRLRLPGRMATTHARTHVHAYTRTHVRQVTTMFEFKRSLDAILRFARQSSPWCKAKENRVWSVGNFRQPTAHPNGRAADRAGLQGSFFPATSDSTDSTDPSAQSVALKSSLLNPAFLEKSPRTRDRLFASTHCKELAGICIHSHAHGWAWERYYTTY